MKRVVGGATAVVLALTACTSAEPGTAPDPGASSSSPAPSEDLSGTPSLDPVEGPTESPGETATVPPADGPVLEVEGVSVRAPRGFRRGYDTFAADSASGKDGIVMLVAIAGDPLSLRALVRRELRTTPTLRGVRRLDDVALAGRSAYHYQARDGHFRTDVFGLWDAGYRVSLHVDLDDDLPADRRREIVESVVATYQSFT